MTRFIQQILSIFAGGKLSPSHQEPASSFYPPAYPPCPADHPPAGSPIAEFIASLPPSAHGTVIAGSMQLVEVAGLQPVGDGKWLGVIEGVRSIADEEISQGMTGAGFHQRAADGRVVLCFDGDDLAAAQTRATAITERIKARMVSEEPASVGRLTVDQFVAPIDRDTILSSELPPLEALLSSLHQIRAEHAEQARCSRLGLLRSAGVQFQPAAARFRGGPTLNRCSMDGIRQTLGSDLFGSDAHSARLVARLDQMLLTKAVERLHGAKTSIDSEALLLVPVHLSTLSEHASSLEFEMLFERIPHSYARLIALEVLLNEAEEPPLHLKASLDSAHRYCPRLFLRLPNCDVRLIRGGLRSALRGVSCHLKSSGIQGPQLDRWLQLVVEAARDAGLLTCATGADTLGHALAARNAGFDFVMGTAISTTLDGPRVTTGLIGARDAAA